MTTAPRHLRLPLLLALALAAVMLAVPAIAQARKPTHGHKAACPPASRSKHRKQACAGKTHVPKSHGRRAATRRRVARRGTAPAGATARPGASGARAMVAAGCEDGSDATATRKGALSCADGSEPTCEDGSSPGRAAGGTALVCLAPPEPASGEALCEASTAPCGDEAEELSDTTRSACADGSTPTPVGQGFYSCGPGGEPACEDGSSPTFSSDGQTFVCQRTG